VQRTRLATYRGNQQASRQGMQIEAAIEAIGVKRGVKRRKTAA
jgi:hypothetical protein